MYDFIDDIVNYINGLGYNASIINRELAVIKFNDVVPVQKLVFVRILDGNNIYFIDIVFKSYANSLPVSTQNNFTSIFTELLSFIWYRSELKFENIQNFNPAKLDKMKEDLQVFDVITS